MSNRFGWLDPPRASHAVSSIERGDACCAARKGVCKKSQSENDIRLAPGHVTVTA
jgi:hypothetical protein